MSISGRVGENKIKHATILQGITRIHERTFEVHTIEHVEILQGVTDIGMKAFSCNPIKMVTLTRDLFENTRAQEGGLSGAFGDKVTTY